MNEQLEEPRHSPVLIAIGGSAGAFDGLIQLLPALPETLTAAVVIVVHVPAERDTGLVQVLAGSSRLRVCEAEDKMRMTAGVIYVAPPDYHLLVEADGSLAPSADEPVHFRGRPSTSCFSRQRTPLASGCSVSYCPAPARTERTVWRRSEPVAA